jgi:hypothetical protein
MPPRGGMADLTDSEIRSAVIYMFNYGLSQQNNSSAICFRFLNVDQSVRKGTVRTSH